MTITRLSSNKTVLFDHLGNPIVTASGLYVQGAVAHDAANDGNPLKIGGKATTGSPTSVANDDIVDANFDEKGKLGVFIGSDGSSSAANVVTSTPGNNVSATRSLNVFGFTHAQAPDGSWDKLATLSDSGVGFNVLAAAPWSIGASEVKAIRGNPTSTTRATLLTPTGGKKVRIISVVMVANSTTATIAELYFDTGANIGSDATKYIYEFHADRAAGNSDNGNLIFPDGGGPIGAADDVVSMRLSVTSDVFVGILYREE